MNIKYNIYKIIEKDDSNYLPSKLFDTLIISLIIINVTIIIADSFNGISLKTLKAFRYIEIFTTIVFTIEYILRVWTSDITYPNYNKIKARIRYIFSFSSIVDILAILPFYIPFFISPSFTVLRMVRLLRLMRILKINRYNNSISDVFSVLKNKSSQILSSMFAVFIMMIISSVLMYTVENKAQPEVFNNVFSSLWWAVATLTTVGYGDIYPITPIGKILSAVIALLGIGLVAVPTGIISSGFFEQIETKRKEAEKSEEKKYCPYCGKKLN